MSDSEAGLFSHRSYLVFWWSRVLGSLAFHMQGVALGWQMYALTGDPLDLGLIGLVQFVPSVLLVLAVGQIADRFDRRRIVIVARIGTALASLVLAVVTAMGQASPGFLFAVAFWIGVAQAFHMPTAQAITPNLVPPRLLPSAIAWSSIGFRGSAILGPMLGGFLTIAGSWLVYSLATVLYTLAAVLIVWVRLAARERSRQPVTTKTLMAGFHFIWHRPVVLGAISLDLFIVLLGGATALMPIYAGEILHVGPWGLGMLRAAPGVGAIIMAAWLVARPMKRRVGQRMFYAAGVFGLATIAFGLSESLTWALVALVILGGADMVNVVIRQSIVQLDTPDDMRGRVSSVNAVFIGGSNRLGEFESGLTAAWWGTVPATLVGGFGTLVVVVVWIRLFPQLWHRETLSVDAPSPLSSSARAAEASPAGESVAGQSVPGHGAARPKTAD